MERWLPIVGFEGLYEVSDHGRVRSLARTITCAVGTTVVVRRLAGKLLKPGTVKSGHQLVVLGRGNSRLVHALVLAAFVGPKPPGLEALHRDGKPARNVLSNLRWGTRSENVRDSVRHGTHRSGAGVGERSPRAVLTELDVLAIRKRLATDSQAAIAADYRVSKSTIGKISSGRNWSHLAQPEASL